MFLKKIKNKIDYLEKLINEKDIEINVLKDKIIDLESIKNINVNRCECGHEEGLDLLGLIDGDGFGCDSSVRIEDGSYYGKFKQYIRLYTCPKCGVVKAIYKN